MPVHDGEDDARLKCRAGGSRGDQAGPLLFMVLNQADTALPTRTSLDSMAKLLEQIEAEISPNAPAGAANE